MSQVEVENIIVGAGPGGLDLAMEFSVLNIKYVLLEKEDKFGGQFWKFPRCGELISLNKKNLPENSPGFGYARRYDWHTLSAVKEADAKEDPKLLFTEWSEQLFPKAKRLAEYLDYLGNHSKWNVRGNTEFNTEITCISRNEQGKFVVSTQKGVTYVANCVFLGTGTSCPLIPNIKGIEECGIFYKDFNPENLEMYRNKRVVVVGSGNSAFEVAHAIREHAGDILMATRSGPRFARQTHNVHDVRTQHSVIYDLSQLKSLVTFISNWDLEEVQRQPNGRILIKTNSPEPLWKKPVWKRQSFEADFIIVCCGFHYTLPNVFKDKSCQPVINPCGKFCSLTSTWESKNIPGLYFIGGSMRVNDKYASSGFIHGFRYNVKTLSLLIAERYYGRPYAPIFETVIDPNDDTTFDSINRFVINYCSDTPSLFELFEYGCSTIIIRRDEESKYKVQVYDALPIEYARERFAHDESIIARIEVVFQYGFRNYGNDIPTQYFYHACDAFHPETSAYIHPVFHVFRHGQNNGRLKQVEEWHLYESLVARWDIDDFNDEPGLNADQYLNVVYNSLASAINIINRKSISPVFDDYVDTYFPAMTEEETHQILEDNPGMRWWKIARDNSDELKRAATQCSYGSGDNFMSLFMNE